MKVGVLVRKKSRNVDGVVQAANIANRLQSDFEFDVVVSNSHLAPGAVSGCVVDQPYLTGLGKSSSSLGSNQENKYVSSEY